MTCITACMGPACLLNVCTSQRLWTHVYRGSLTRKRGVSVMVQVRATAGVHAEGRVLQEWALLTRRPCTWFSSTFCMPCSLICKPPRVENCELQQKPCAPIVTLRHLYWGAIQVSMQR
jgi:hypothetical protein